MDHWKKVYELGGRLGFVRGLFEFTANHVHYQYFLRNFLFLSSFEYWKIVIFHSFWVIILVLYPQNRRMSFQLFFFLFKASNQVINISNFY